MIIDLQPKRDFLRDSKRGSAHQDVMSSPFFQDAAKAALLEYQVRLANGPVEAAIVAVHRLRGAEDFLRILLNLGEPEKPQVKAESQALIPT